MARIVQSSGYGLNSAPGACRGLNSGCSGDEEGMEGTSGGIGNQGGEGSSGKCPRRQFISLLGNEETQ